AGYEALKAFDVDGATAPVRKAMIDWPDKRNDLQTRLDGLKSLQTQGEQLWDSTASIRTAAQENKLTDTGYAAFFSSADHLDRVSRQVQDGAASLNALSAQLYASWDKMVAGADREDGYREKVRTVRTEFPDATLAGGKTTSEEHWRTIDAEEYREA